MSTLILVRHGQASFGAADYDNLSPLGHEQGRSLGRWWASRGFCPQAVYVGPRRRHRQTMEATAAELQAAGLPWPDPIELPGLDEYDADALLTLALPQVLARHPRLGDELRRFQAGGPDAARGFQRVLEVVGRAWARAEVQAEGLPTWASFRAAVEGACQQMMAEADRSATIAAFTSGGPVAAATGMALELGHVQTLELSWQVYNAALARLMFASGGDRLTLNAFNATDHLDALTWR